MYMSFSNYVNVFLIHAQILEHCHTSVITVIPKSFLSVTLIIFFVKKLHGDK